MAICCVAAALAAAGDETRKMAQTVAHDLDVQSKLPRESGSVADGPEEAVKIWVPGSDARPEISIPGEILEAVRWAFETYPVACLITEPILQNIGVVKPKPGYLQGVRRLCDVALRDSQGRITSALDGLGRR